MTEIADPPPVCCFLLHSASGSEPSQSLAPDLFAFRARARAYAREDEAGRGASEEPARGPHGHFAKGHSGNPKGRPRGIPNPKRRVLTLQAYRRNPQAALALLDRKPQLLRPLLAQALPPRAKPQDPADRLGIGISELQDAAAVQQALQRVWDALCEAEIGPREAGRLARRIRTRLRGIRRLQRLARQIARLSRKTAPPALRPVKMPAKIRSNLEGGRNI